MLSYLAAIPLSLLPEKLRERWMQSSDPSLRMGAILSGLAQCLLFFVLANILRLEAVPLTIILYFSVEGLARFVAASANVELLPSLPLYLISMMVAEKDARRERDSRPKTVPDIVAKTTDELVIRSCAAKDWNQFTTVRYLDVLYEILGEETGDSSRPFCYRLRPIAEGKLIRGIRDYSPGDGVQQR